MTFVDTNVWLRAVQPTHPLHQVAVDSIAALIGVSDALVVTPQIAAEFWNVTTRPVAANGLGLSTDEAREQMAKLESFFSVLSESAEVFAEWKRLVVTHGVQGVQQRSCVPSCWPNWSQARVVSHGFDMDDWEPDRMIMANDDALYLWTIGRG